MQHKNCRNVLKGNGYRKGINLTFILIMSLVLLMTGCGSKKEKSETQSGNNAISESQDGTATDESDLNSNEDSDFDFSQVFDNIEINGTKVSMPFTLNDLGEGYEFGPTIVDHEDGTFYTSLYYNGTQISGAYIIEESKEKIGNDSPIYRLELYSNISQNIKIKGISFNSSSEEIEKTFANIPVQYDKDGIEMGYVARNNNNVFDIFINNEKVEIISIIKGDELHD